MKPKFNNFWAKLMNKNKNPLDKGKKSPIWSKKSNKSKIIKKQKISDKFLTAATKDR